MLRQLSRNLRAGQFALLSQRPSASTRKLTMAAPSTPTELGRLRILSPTAGVRVSPLQLGGMSIGDAWAGASKSL